MKLPEIQYKTQVGSLGRRGFALTSAKIREELAKGGVGVAIGEAISDIANDIYDRQGAMEVERAQAYRLDQEAELLKQHGPDKRFYEPDELPDRLRVNREAEDPSQIGILEGRPAHEVQHEILREERDRIADEASAFITDPQIRSEFAARTNKLNSAQYIRDLRDSQVKQIDHRRDEQQAMIQKLADNGQYAGAKYIASNFEGTPEERNALQHGVSVREEEDPMSHAIAIQDVGMMQAQVEELNKEDYNGSLTQKQRTSWVSKLRSEIYKAQKADRDLLQANRQGWRAEGRMYVDVLKTGSAGVSAEEANRIKGNLIVSGEPQDQILLNQIYIHEDAQETISTVNRWPAHVRERAKFETRDLLGGSVRDAYLHNFISSSIDKMQQEEAANSSEYSLKIGMTRPVPFDTNNLVLVLRELRKNEQITHNNLKKTTGLFTRAQELQWAEYINDTARNRRDELAPTFAQVHEALGNESYKAYEPIKDSVGTLAMAGQIWHDNPKGSNLIVKGRSHRIEFDNVLNEIEVDLDQKIMDELGLVYMNKTGQHKLRAEAIKDVYVAMSFAEGQKKVTVPLTSIDNDMLKTAIQTVTGGLTEVNGRKVEPAYYNQPPDELEDFMTSSSTGFTRNELKAMGTPLNFPYYKLKQEIEADKIEWYSLGKNEYGMYYTSSNQWIFDEDTGGIFRFRYNRNDANIPPDIIKMDPEIKKAQEAVEFDREQFREQVKAVGERTRNFADTLRGLAKDIGDFLVSPIGELEFSSPGAPEAAVEEDEIEF